MMEVATFALAGFVTGIFSGALGVGGALLATPLIRFLGVGAYLAIGTTVPVMLPTTITGAYTYHREKLVDFRAAVWTAASGVAFVVVGALSTRHIDRGGGHALMLITAVVLFFSGMRLLPSRSKIVEPAEPIRSIPAFLAIGAVSGFLSGLLGVGGGIIMVPAFISLMRLPTKTALGTSLAVITLTVIPNVIAQSFAAPCLSISSCGNIDWTVALPLSIGVIPGARLGAKLSIRAPERALRIVMVIAITSIALVYAWREIAELSSL
ncbi:MAG: sulfite exporter TauE/SafE family protein [Actinobacteria bacterium]|nr:sulfite exporter TauE/SafE family protein [Actinomycetota bacterium]